MKKIIAVILAALSVASLAGCGNKSTEVKVESISLNETSYTLEVGQTFTLIPTVLPGNATNKNVTWRTSNSAIVSIDNGLVTALSNGQATITAITVDQNKTATCIFNVVNHITKILSIGNSFGEDTSRYAPAIAENIGFDCLLGHMFIGGCSVQLHKQNADSNAKSYRYYKSYKQGWLEKENVSIEDGVVDEPWDYIMINGLSTVTDFESDLDALLKYIGVRALNPDVKLGFNFVHSYNSKGEMYKSPNPPQDTGLAWFYNNFKTYNFNHSTMFANLSSLASSWKSETLYGDFVMPMGTAIENAKLIFDENDLHRDEFHLSHFLGRYIAALTYMFYFSGIRECAFVPTFLTEQEVKYAVKCATAAINKPYEVTDVRGN